MALATADELLATFVPVVVYWVYSGMCVMLELMENYKLYSKKDEDEKNLVSRMTVVKGVLFHQTMQSTISLLAIKVLGGNDVGEPSSSVVDIIRQMVIGLVALDTWSYFTHRLYHQNKWLYRYVHSTHHRVFVNYAFAASYMHPIEGLIESVGAALTAIVSGMSPRTSMYFFSFALIKTVDDHCGMMLPLNPFHLFLTNNSAYHDVHHQLYGAKYNFSTYSTFWDRILGTYMLPGSAHNKGNRAQARHADQECNLMTFSWYYPLINCGLIAVMLRGLPISKEHINYSMYLD